MCGNVRALKSEPKISIALCEPVEAKLVFKLPVANDYIVAIH